MVRVEFDVHAPSSTLVSVELSNEDVREYLELSSLRDRDRWIDEHVDEWIATAWLNPEWLIDSEVEFIDLPESLDDLPPAIHPNQTTLDI